MESSIICMYENKIAWNIWMLNRIHCSWYVCQGCMSDEKNIMNVIYELCVLDQV